MFPFDIDESDIEDNSVQVINDDSGESEEEDDEIDKKVIDFCEIDIRIYNYVIICLLIAFKIICQLPFLSFYLRHFWKFLEI